MGKEHRNYSKEQRVSEKKMEKPMGFLSAREERWKKIRFHSDIPPAMREGGA